MDKRWFQDRLKHLKKTQAQLAEHLGLPAPRITDILNQNRKVSAVESAQIAEFLDVPLAVLVNKLGSGYKTEPLKFIPVVGYVGAGEMVVPLTKGDTEQDLKQIEAPPGIEGDFAVEIRGQSMHPRFRDGDFLVCDRDLGSDLSNCIGKECCVRLVSGEVLIKLCERGNAPDTLTLVSINASAPIMQDVAVQWAAPILWIRPKR